MFTVKRAAELTGLSPDTLRVWERRYRVVVPERSPGGYRLYDDAALRRLAAMKELVDSGWSVRSAAERVLDNGSAGARPAPATGVAPGLDSLAGAARDFDPDALTAALDRLEARKAEDGELPPAAIVLLSDGKTTQGGDPLEAAARARRLGVPVYTVALGTPEGVVSGGPLGEPIPVPPDPETLRAIARESGGRAFEVDDADALEQVYEDLGSRVGTRPERRELTAAFAGASLLLLAGGLGTGLRWRGRVA